MSALLTRSIKTESKKLNWTKKVVKPLNVALGRKVVNVLVLIKNL